MKLKLTYQTDEQKAAAGVLAALPEKGGSGA